MARSATVALMALCLSSSVYCFADEPTCSYGEDGKPDTCSFESGDLYEVWQEAEEGIIGLETREAGEQKRKHRSRAWRCAWRLPMCLCPLSP